MRPIVETRITHHTLWQALTGKTPPLSLPAKPLAKAVLDSRDVAVGDLFVALSGRNMDGHDYIHAALQNQAAAIISEPRGRAAASEHEATIIDCTDHRNTSSSQKSVWPDVMAEKPIVYLVEDSERALQAAGAFQRLHRHRRDLRVIGITGSVGKSTSKELIAALLRERYKTLHSSGNLNNEQGLPLTLLGLGPEHERAVLEMGMYALGEISDLCRWARPHIGVVTNVMPVHLERLGSIENIVQAKSELIRALPAADDGGVAVLNWDDKLVRSMADMTDARLFRYGLTPDANLWADEIESAGMEGIRFRFHYNPDGREKGGSRIWPRKAKIDSIHVRVPLLGRHSVHTALRAAAVGLVEGLSWEEIIAGMQNSGNQLRLVVVAGINGSTIIDDTYNASPASTVAALNLLADLAPTRGGRRVAVLGDMLELGQYTNEGHKLVARRAAGVVDQLITVGELGRYLGEEALAVGLNKSQVHIFGEQDEAIAYLIEAIQAGDLVLVKGSQAVGMDTIAAEITVTGNK